MCECPHCGLGFANNIYRDIHIRAGGEYDCYYLKWLITPKYKMCLNPNNNKNCQIVCISRKTKHGLCRSCSAQENWNDCNKGKTLEEVVGNDRAQQLKAMYSVKSKAWHDKNPNIYNGIGNPNYGNEWSDEQKLIASNQTIRQWMELSEDEKQIRRDNSKNILLRSDVRLKAIIGINKYLSSDKSTKKDTAPERKFKAILNKLGFAYIQQYIVGYYTVDFYLLDYDLYVEIDGDYWHGHPVKFTVLNDMQKRNKHRDSSKNTYMKNRNKLMIRFWENDLNCNEEYVVEQLLATIQFKCLIESIGI